MFKSRNFLASSGSAGSDASSESPSPSSRSSEKPSKSACRGIFLGGDVKILVCCDIAESFLLGPGLRSSASGVVVPGTLESVVAGESS